MPKRDHELVPAHRIISRSDANELFEKMGIGANNLPKVIASDPQVQKIGAKVGDIIKTERSDFGKKYDYFRLVIEG